MNSRRLRFCIPAVFVVTPLFAQPPSNVSVTPSSGGGASQTFAFAASSSGGAGYLATMNVLFSNALDGNAACYLQYATGSNTLSLFSDHSGQWIASGTLGSAGTLSNSQCQVSLAGSSVTSSGNTLTLHLAITFNASYYGTQAIFMTAADNGGLSSGWQQMGTWVSNPPVTTQPPAPAVSPASGTGLAQTFTYTISDANGGGYVAYMYALFNTSVSGPNACYLIYNQTDELFALYNDATTATTSAYLGSNTVLQNSQCSLNVGQSSVTVTSSGLTVSFALTFASGFSGTKNDYAEVVDRANATLGWQTLGAWTIGSPQPPSNVSVTPSSGGGASQTFAFAASSSGGAGYLAMIDVLFSNALDGNAACYLQYATGSNTLSLFSDHSGQWIASGTLGSAGTLSNSQCQVSLAGSSVISSGNTLTLHLAITFNASYYGTQAIFMTAADSGGLSSGWQQMGTWVSNPPVTTQPPAPAVSPASGTGLAQTFTYTISDANGGGYVAYMYALFNTSVSGPNACYLIYNQTDELFALYNDATTATTSAYLGSSTVLQNSQCSLNVGQSSVAVTSSGLTVSFALTFASGFSGTKNDYAEVVDRANATLGWQTLGAWNFAPASSVTISSVALDGSSSPISLANGQTGTVVVWLSGPAPSGGITVTLTANSSGLIVFPGQAAQIGLTIPAGSTASSAVTITALSIPSTRTLVVQATGGASQDVASPVITILGTPVPSISQISPTTGPPGTQVTINGTNFGTTQGTVAFGSAPAAIVSWAPTQITALAPAGLSSAVSVAVAVSGYSPVTSSTQFTESPAPPGPNITGLSLSQGPAQVGFTITGSGFGGTQPGGSPVTLNGNALTVVPGTWSDIGITVQVPAGTAVTPAGTTWNVVVTVGGTASNPWPFAVSGAFGCVIQ